MVMQAVQSLLDIEVSLAPWTGQDRYGQATYGASKTYKARIEDTTDEVQSQGGQTLRAKYKVILGSAVQVDPRDQLTLPATFGTRNTSGVFETVIPPILRVRPVYFQGQHDHTILWC